MKLIFGKHPLLKRLGSGGIPSDKQPWLLYGIILLKITSWVKVASLASLPKVAISRWLGRLDAHSLSEVEKRLRLALELGEA